MKLPIQWKISAVVAGITLAGAGIFPAFFFQKEQALLNDVEWAVLYGVLTAVGALIVKKMLSRQMYTLIKYAAPDGKTPPFDAQTRAMPIEILVRQLRERLAAWEARMESAESRLAMLEAILRSMSEGVLAVDSRLNVLLMNEALKRLFNAQEPVVGRNLFEVIRKTDLGDFASEILRQAPEVKVREITLLFPEEKNLLVYATPLIAHGRQEGAVLVFHDITPLRRVERVRRDFVANVSHELRTPLASIHGYAEALLDGALGDPKTAADFLNIILDSSARLGRMVEDLLELTRVQSNRTRSRFGPVEAAQLVERTMRVLAPVAAQKKMMLQFLPPAAPSRILCDADDIVRALVNLVDNAIKYSDSGKTVKIRLETREGATGFFVADEGIGIPENEVDRIFERFYRVDKARTDRPGAGLGLAIVKHVVENHGGMLGVKSKLGEGSVFHFSIPSA